MGLGSVRGDFFLQPDGSARRSAAAAATRRLKMKIPVTVSSILGAGREATVNPWWAKNLDAAFAMRHFEGMGEEALQKSLAIYKGLVEVSCLINSITDHDALLRAILSVARPVMGAEAASIFWWRIGAVPRDSPALGIGWFVSRMDWPSHGELAV